MVGSAPSRIDAGASTRRKCSAGTSEDRFWDLFASSERSLEHVTIYDPFAGGGSTVVEAARLGAAVWGADIDPLATEIVRHELAPVAGDERWPPLSQSLSACCTSLDATIRSPTGRRHRSTTSGCHELSVPLANERDCFTGTWFLAETPGREGLWSETLHLLSFARKTLRSSSYPLRIAESSSTMGDVYGFTAALSRGSPSLPILWRRIVAQGPSDWDCAPAIGCSGGHHARGTPSLA